MTILSKEQILILHSQLIKATGGIDGLRDEGRPEGAVGLPAGRVGQERLGDLAWNGPIKRIETPGTFRQKTR